MNDKYVDLMALVLGHHSESSAVNYEKVIIKSEHDDSNPSLADLMDVKFRWAFDWLEIECKTGFSLAGTQADEETLLGEMMIKLLLSQLRSAKIHFITLGN